MPKNITIFTVDHSEYTSVILSKFLNTYGYKVNRIYISKTLFNFRFIKKNFWFFIKNRYPFCIKFKDWLAYLRLKFNIHKSNNKNMLSYYKSLGFDVKIVNSINSTDFLKEANSLKSDFFIFLLFDQIAGESFINIPKKGIYNLHLGKLPEYRGGLSSFWVLRDGDKTAGVSLHEVISKLDAGKIVSERRFLINTNSMHDLMTKTVSYGADVVLEGMEAIINDKIKPISIKGRNESYKLLPTSDDFKTFYAKGNRLV